MYTKDSDLFKPWQTTNNGVKKKMLKSERCLIQTSCLCIIYLNMYIFLRELIFI